MGISDVFSDEWLIYMDCSDILSQLTTVKLGYILLSFPHRIRELIVLPLPLICIAHPHKKQKPAK